MYYHILLLALFAPLVLGLATNETICLQSGLNMRSSPCGNIVKQATGSEKGAIVEGPKTQSCSGTSYEWYQVNIFGDETTYWVADVSGLITQCSVAVCFEEGLNMRSSPCGNVVGQSTANEKGTIIGSPVIKTCSGTQYTWWEVDVTSENMYMWVAEETGLVSTVCGGGGGNVTNGTYANDCPFGSSPRDPAFEKAVPCLGPNGLGCCCNEFVEGMFGNNSLGNSQEMFTTLPEIGWCQCNGCIPNGIATNPVHVAFVYACNENTGGVELYGANQSCQIGDGTACFEQCGCDNVSILSCCYPQSNFTYFHTSCC